MNALQKHADLRLFSLGCLAALAAIACGALPAKAQSFVQLPRFHFFTVSTSVLVPDGGDAALGGDVLSSTGSRQRGIPGLPGNPFPNFAAGADLAAGTALVHAEIQNLPAMDQALLATVHEGPLLVSSSAPAGQNPNLQPPLVSVAAIRAQLAAEDAAQEHEAAENLAQARQLLGEGKTSVAKIYLQMALRKSMPQGEIHQQALAVWRTIESAKSPAKIAGQ